MTDQECEQLFEMIEFSMEGKEIVALDEERLQQLCDAGYSEIEEVPDRGNIVNGKWEGVPLNDALARASATHEIRVFRKFLETGYKGKITFVNKTKLEEIVYAVAEV